MDNERDCEWTSKGKLRLNRETFLFVYELARERGWDFKRLTEIFGQNIWNWDWLFIQKENGIVGDAGNLPTLNLEELERMAILEALERCNWSQKKAAVLLGVSSRALNHKIGLFEIKHKNWVKNK